MKEYKVERVPYSSTVGSGIMLSTASDGRAVGQLILITHDLDIRSDRDAYRAFQNGVFDVVEKALKEHFK